MLNKLRAFIRRAIFERGYYIVPPEEEGGYIIPKIWLECGAIERWIKEEEKNGSNE